MKDQHVGQAVGTALTLVLDVALYNVAILLAYDLGFLGHPGSQNLWAFWNQTMLLLVCPALVFWLSGVYQMDWLLARVEDHVRVIQACVLNGVVLLLVSYIFRGEKAPTSGLVTGVPVRVIVLSIPASAILVSGWRMVLQRFLRWAGSRRGFRPRVVVVFGEEGALARVAQLRAELEPSYLVVGVFCPEGLVGLDPQLTRLGGPADLGAQLSLDPPDELVLITRGFDTETVLAVIQECERHRIDYRVQASFLDVLTSGAEVLLLGTVPTLRYGQLDILGWNALFKRLLDLSVAIPTLVLSLPLLVLGGLAVVITTGTAPLFIQVRTGRYGRPFRLFKLRTMIEGASSMGPVTVEDDTRVTRVGRWLRRFSIDELPQLINVVMGEMSLVGPRAVVPYVSSRFSDVEKLTLNVPPGMTGLAQVSGRDRLDFREKSLLNLYYIRHYGLLLDLKILARTWWVVLRGTGTEGTRHQP